MTSCCTADGFNACKRGDNDDIIRNLFHSHGALIFISEQDLNRRIVVMEKADENNLDGQDEY